ncbi:tRNA dihydrouridine(20/20a) synthase DusA [Henriciella barbarensis]|uniref:tRNA-dihydrouridine(20/20a) synthase n=1 Tax=Henriciella barbarensis TaxID=86342 RepID=A0A399QYV1_9PROT|nr:tRNA dihydrouridine(20/20a) synthase DusA [Henriciella barbarensis]RIJ23305.1 tRNA dihydrouridine(20/20a) synthase DusA [Henriciella barbarensis]
MPGTSTYPTPTTYRFSVAPMMDWTDRHCRMFHRALSKDALLWTEMVTADAVIHGDRERLIGFSAAEHPLVLQLGGSDPAKLAEASRIAEEFGYDEVNINCGCPSDRVQSGRFGACLMQEPSTVAACVAAMRNAVSIPVTVKCRVAVDDDPPRETLFGFVDQVADAGCEVFTVHARKAWLSGLSPKENRDIPPLDYGLVADLKAERPDLTLILNGGIKTMADAAAHLQTFDGVMLGRAAYQTPSCLLSADQLIHDGTGDDTFDMAGALTALERYRPYMAARLDEGIKLSSMTRHMLGLFAGQPGARAWRRTLSEKAVKEGAGLDILDEALSHVAGMEVDA